MKLPMLALALLLILLGAALKERARIAFEWRESTWKQKAVVLIGLGGFVSGIIFWAFTVFIE